MNAAIWIVGVGAIFGVLLVGGMLDWHLAAAGLPTVTDWLRARPARFWVPFAGMALFQAGMVLHLFICVARRG